MPALEPTTATARPKLARASRQDSELFASYYQSPLADAGIGYDNHRKSLSGESTSSSDYSSDESSVSPPRRPSLPSEGGNDRRRLAIVQTDSQPVAKAPNLDGIALVAPPDAKSSAYIHDKSHHRSASEVSNKASRDVGIVGTSTDLPRIEIPSLQPPVFQEPHPSRAATPNSLPGPKRRSTDLSIRTPELGQSKKIDAPVAPPVVVDLGLDPSLSPSIARDYSAYLKYEPGLHSTAGPLPPPPRTTFAINPSTPPPPRPPRLHSPPPTNRKDGLQLPGVTAVLSSSGSSTPSSSNSRSVSPARPLGSSGDDSPHDDTLHRREGAFSPSVISTSPSEYSPPTVHVNRSINGMIAEEAKDEQHASVVVSPPQPTIAEEWTPSRSSDDHASQDAISWESFSQEGFTPSPPPKSFRASLTKGLRRISSIPRTSSPSRNSLTRSSTSRSPPASHPVSLPIRRPPKIIEQYPAALFSADILSLKKSTDRTALYAQKINELYIHDSGLSDWLVATHTHNAGGGKRGTITAKPRQVSRSSIKSHATQATFPRRPDAMVATDLATKPSDIAPTAPSLPYPALSPRSMTAPLSPPTSLRMLAVSPAKGNFFSSLGRKASMSRKDKPNMSFSATTTRLVKSPPPSVSRPLLVPNSPAVPGGPRAPPNRAQKTQSISPTPSPLSSNAAALRRPSLFTPTTSSSSSESRDRAFESQVDKLSDLLPQAERSVLAGYLRRAGQDMLAIGQYLEDEKNGRVRRE
ncbi:hypothetical protein MIND_00716700 [Mycena indigotica]|uniref:Uncharacterized protein n=1 Tax=Mycena indigotica TaxID=2126181 RepID=A0A8H6SKY0_9AGAR|nr:uncharacterized protein MIND_00716700 [Mycena indigotica]KAF7301513.1 hypothetical protein MIND_00716700 [Mycena indigotica]